jgi:hypothetical protein
MQAAQVDGRAGRKAVTATPAMMILCSPPLKALLLGAIIYGAGRSADGVPFTELTFGRGTMCPHFELD